MPPKTPKTLTPKRRFPEFRGAGHWCEPYVGDVMTVRDERQPPSESVPLFSLTIEGGVTEKTARYNREFLVTNAKKKYKVVKYDDLVYNPSNLRWGAINFSQVKHDVVVSPIYEVLYLSQPDENIAAFVQCALMRPEQIKQFIRMGQGTLVERIAVKIEDFVATPMPLPSPAEQQKIADCLGSLDDWIAAAGRKLAALRDHKRGLLQQLFPQPGQSQPQQRFPEFRKAGKWKLKKVGDVFTVTRGQVLAMPLVDEEQSEDMPYPVYSSRTKDEGLSGYYSDYLFENAITWTTDGANAGDVNYRPGKFYCTNVCGVLLNDEGYANPCIAALLNTVTRDHVSYVGNPKLMNGVMANIEVAFPSLEEQQKIAACLTALDTQITAQAAQLDTLHQHKRGLMQQLFPLSEDAS
jgi:type I restriction enzyme S subunit